MKRAIFLGCALMAVSAAGSAHAQDIGTVLGQMPVAPFEAGMLQCAEGSGSPAECDTIRLFWEGAGTFQEGRANFAAQFAVHVAATPPAAPRPAAIAHRLYAQVLLAGRDVDRAARQLEAAVALDRRLPPSSERTELTLLAAEIGWRRGEVARARSILQDLIDAAGTAASLRLRALVLLARIAVDVGDVASAHATAAQGMRIAADLRGSTTMIEMEVLIRRFQFLQLGMLAQTDSSVVEVDVARQFFEVFGDVDPVIARAQRDSPTSVIALIDPVMDMIAALADYSSVRPGQASAMLAQIATAIESPKMPATAARDRARIRLGRVLMMRGDVAGSARQCQSARTALERAPANFAPEDRVTLYTCLAMGSGNRGDVIAFRAELDKAVAAARSLPDYVRPVIELNIMIALVSSGNMRANANPVSLAAIRRAESGIANRLRSTTDPATSSLLGDAASVAKWHVAQAWGAAHPVRPRN